MGALERKQQNLFWACTNNQLETVEAALSGSQTMFGTYIEAVDINCVDQDGNTPLSCAVQTGHRGIVQFLLQKGADPNKKNKIGRTPLMHAAARGHKSIMIDLLKKNAQLEEKNDTGKNALIYAAEAGEGSAVILLLERKALVDEKDDDNKTALIYAAIRGDMVSLAALLDAKADINARDTSNCTALIHASRCGKKIIVEELLKRGANTDIKSNDGWTALSVGSDEIKKMIQAHIEQRAVPKTTDQQPVPETPEAKIRAAFEKEGLDPKKTQQWRPIGDGAIDCILASTDSPKILSIVFNFVASQYIVASKDILTDEKATVSGALDEFPNPGLVVEGYQMLLSLGKKPPPLTLKTTTP